MIRSHEAGSLRADVAGAEVTLAGWVASRRDHGGVVFIDLRDASGVVQCVLREGTGAELRNEFCLRVVGEVSPRHDGSSGMIDALHRLPFGSIQLSERPGSGA